MPESSQTFERTRDGFRTRLRYGKGLRGRFLITLDDERMAERRWKTGMRDVATLLMRAGHSARAPIILEEAGKAPTERDLADAVRIAEALCVGKGSGKRKVSAVIARGFAERWTDGTLTRDHSRSRRSQKDCGPRWFPASRSSAR